MKNKQYKITKSELFKEQEKRLPKDIQEEVAKALANISKNPAGCQHSMSVFGKPSAEELRQWMGRVKPGTIDLVLEYLSDKDCLRKRGRELAREFWSKYIKEETKK